MNRERYLECLATSPAYRAVSTPLDDEPVTADDSEAIREGDHRSPNGPGRFARYHSPRIQPAMKFVWPESARTDRVE